jgi:hypothetical protein
MAQFSFEGSSEDARVVAGLRFGFTYPIEPL